MKQADEKTRWVTWLPFGQHSDASQGIVYVVMPPMSETALRVNIGGTHAALAGRLNELDARFGRDVSALWVRLVQELQATGSDPRAPGSDSAETLFRVCEKGLHFFSEILARNGRADVIDRGLQYAKAHFAPPADIQDGPDPCRN